MISRFLIFLCSQITSLSVLFLDNTVLIPILFVNAKTLCNIGLRISRDNTIHFLSLIPNTAARFVAIVVLPSPGTVELTTITLLLFSVGINSKFVRINRKASLATDCWSSIVNILSAARTCGITP